MDLSPVNEACLGHVDTDDVRVIHLTGEKRWRHYHRQPSVERALQLMLLHYDKDSSPRPGSPREEFDKLFRLGQSSAFASDLAQPSASEKAAQQEFRQLLTENRVTYLDRLIQAEPSGAAPRIPAPKFATARK